MVVVIQIVCLLLAVCSLGNAFRGNATKFDKISFSVVSILYLIMCIGLQGVK